MQSWTIILFGYNESKTIKDVFFKSKDIISQITNDYEIIIIDDGSTDSSVEIILEIKRKYTFVKTFFNKKNIGIGKTLLTGYLLAKKENICSIPLDGQFDSNELLKVSSINFTDEKFISFYRDINNQYSFIRKILNFSNYYINFLFCGINLKDVNWIKVYKKKQILNLNLFMKTSLLESEICSKLILNKKIPIQITSNYLPRKYGKSKVTNLKRLSKVIYEIPKLIFVILIFRISKLLTVKQKIKR